MHLNVELKVGEIYFFFPRIQNTETLPRGGNGWTQNNKPKMIKGRETEARIFMLLFIYDCYLMMSTYQRSFDFKMPHLKLP